MKKTVILKIILILTVFNLNAQFNEANQLYREFQFNDALEKLNSFNDLDDQSSFLKMKTLNCLGKFEESEKLKNQFLESSNNTSLKNKVVEYFDFIKEFKIIKPEYKFEFKPEYVTINGEKFELRKESDGMRIVQDEDNLEYVFDKYDKLIYKAKPGENISEFKNGFAFVDNLYDFKIINSNGDEIYSDKRVVAFDYGPKEFNNGFVVIGKIYRLEGERYASKLPVAINTNGEIIYDFRSDEFITAYKNGYAAYGKMELLRTADGALFGELNQYGIKDKNGNTIIDFKKIGCYNCKTDEFNKDGIASITSLINDKGDKKYGFIDLAGKIKWYDYDINFHNDMYNGKYDLGVISNNGKYGYANKARKIIIDFKFNDAKNFGNGIAVVNPEYSNFKQRYINTKGEYISPKTFDVAGSFNNDDTFSFVSIKGRSYLIDLDINPLLAIPKEDNSTKFSKEEITNKFFSWWKITKSKTLVERILNFYGEDLESEKDIELITKFFKDNREYLSAKPTLNYNCINNSTERDILKVLMLDGQWHIMELIFDSEAEEVFNHYEIVNGKKETLLDLMDCLISDTEDSDYFNMMTLEEMREFLIDVGGKKGSEL